MPHTGPLRWALGPLLYQEHTDEEMTSSSSQANSISVIVTMALVKWMISLWISLCGCKKAPQVSKSSTRWTLVAVWHLTRAWEQAKVPFPEDRVCRGPSFSWSCSKEASLAMLSLQSATSIIKGQMGSWIWRVIGSRPEIVYISRQVEHRPKIATLWS